MMGNAHLAFGVGSYLAVASVYGHTPSFIEITAAALGSLMPDADHPRSKIGRWLPGISHFFYYLGGGHRGITHSLWVLLPLVFVAQWLLASHYQQLWWFSNTDLQTTVHGFGYLVLVAFIWGYFSHLLGDLLSTEGLRLFYPLPWRFKPSPFNSNSPVLYLLAWGMLALGTYLQAPILFSFL